LLRDRVMNETMLMIVVGLAILVSMVALGKLVGKRANASPRGRMAATRGWVYEGFDEWTCAVPGVYQWHMRQTLVDSEASDPQIEFAAGFQKLAACELHIAPIQSERAKEFAKQSALTRIECTDREFDAVYALFTDSPNEARDIFTDDLVQRWKAWLHARPTTMEIDLHRQSLSVQIPYRAFHDDADAEYFISFGEQLLKNVMA
jgi:hypothetical protein